METARPSLSRFVHGDLENLVQLAVIARHPAVVVGCDHAAGVLGHVERVDILAQRRARELVALHISPVQALAAIIKALKVRRKGAAVRRPDRRRGGDHLALVGIYSHVALARVHLFGDEEPAALFIIVDVIDDGLTVDRADLRAGRAVQYVDALALTARDDAIVRVVVDDGAHRAPGGIAPDLVVVRVHTDDGVLIRAQIGILQRAGIRHAVVLKLASIGEPVHDIQPVARGDIRGDGSAQREGEHDRENQIRRDSPELRLSFFSSVLHVERLLR